MMKRCWYCAILAVAVMMGGKSTRAFELDEINVHGLISQGYLITSDNNFMADTENGTPKFHETALNFSTNLTNRLHIGMQLFAYTLGDEGHDDVNFDWALADYHWRDELGIRIGKMKVVSGLYSERRQLDMLRPNIFLPFSVYLGPWRESVSSIKGLTAYGEFSLGKGGELAYTLQGGVGNFEADSGMGKAIEQGYKQLSLDVRDLDSDYAYIGSVEWTTPYENLRAKATFLTVNNLRFQGTGVVPLPVETVETGIDYEFTTIYNYVLSSEFRWRDFLFATEYSSYQADGRWDLHLGQGWENVPSSTSEGWYLSGAYRLTEWFELGMWYSEFYPDKDDKDGSLQATNDFEAWQKTIALSTRFDLNEFWLAKLEVSYNDGFGVYNIVENSDGLDRYWWLYSAKITFNF